MDNLIICPVGNSLTFDDRFDKNSHWRYTNPNRLYQTCVVQYGSFIPEENTYDFLIEQKGMKWQLIKNYLSVVDYTNYEYIGFFDDDLITDVDNVNRAITVAKENNLKLFQMSVTEDSDVFYPILRHKQELKYSKTNFIEVMAPFIHTSLIPICLELWQQYDISSGWGFDKVLCDLTKEDAAVIHCSQMHHPKKETSYNKTNAFAEMNNLLFGIFPKFMMNKYNENWKFKEMQIEKQLIMESK